MKLIINLCFSLGLWFIVKAIGLEINMLFPIGLLLALTGLDMKSK